jgi:GTPase SAR1 family protein
MFIAQKIGATSYVECSAMTGEGVGEVFDAAARALLKREAEPGDPQRKEKISSCIII